MKRPLITIPVRGRVRRLHLSEVRVRRLEDAARAVGVAVETADGTAPQPGWRALVYAIAEGRVRVERAEWESDRQELCPAVCKDPRCPGDWQE